MDKPERFREFLRRMAEAPLCGSVGEARILLAAVLNAVEDELKDIPFDPGLPQTDGRMYPPQDDSERAVPGRSDVRRFRNAQHNTFIGVGGAIRIEEINGSCVLNKPGLDSRRIEWSPSISLP
jgi:hypothetical protein